MAKPVRRRRARLWALGAVVLAGIGVATPIVTLNIGTGRARACFASLPAPRGADLPNCRREIQWFVMPSRVPWTSSTARYRAEEVGARVAIAAYTDALVGYPDREAKKRAAEGILGSEEVLRKGSRRLALEDLGAAVGAPNLGRQAELSGDRGTLLARFDRWTEWDIQLRALEAALTEGDLEQAAVIARRYAAFDPHDQELRAAVAAMLCLGDDTQRGLELFFAIQNHRASQRHESWARNWGEVRAAMVLCATRAKVLPPPRPEQADAGQLDLDEVRIALRLRLIARSSRPSGADEQAARDAAAHTHEMLQAPRSAGARVKLLAALLAGKQELLPAEIAAVATPDKGTKEPPLLPSPAGLTALAWLPTRRDISPVTPAPVLRKAASTLKALAASGSVTAEGADALRAAAGAAAVEAARIYAATGDAPSAIAALDEAGEGALPGAVARALGRSSVYYLAGERERALDELAQVAAALDAPLEGERERGSPTHVEGDKGLGFVAAALVQRTELLGSLGRRDDALKAAHRAEAAAAASADRGLSVRARWTRLALTPKTTPLLPPLERLPRLERSWPWVGAVGTPASWLSPEAEGATRLDRALAFFHIARAASPEVRRARRYEAFAHRGDLPNAMVAYFALAAELVAPGDGDVELWLDAFSAIDAHTLPLSTYAWLRAEAARLRGDAASAAMWAKRYRALSAIALDPMRAEIAMVLGL